ncbi:MAG: peptidoglycan DD-metalloendopeptidase family protein [Lachnospiraceae bacterium]|nr:peptidoglycan DD-metalloendopeptidase family protein [Lachnospiraceae bacterium]
MRKRRVPILLALVLFLSVFLSSESMMYTRAEITSDSIKEKQKQISQTQDEQKKIQQGLSDIKKMKKELETSKSNLEAYVTQLDGDLNVITAKIEELQGVIDETQVALDEATNDYNEAVRVETEQYEAMKVRIQFMYEKGNNFLLDAILGAQSFSEILNRANYYEEIAAYDRKKLDEYVLNRQMVEACKEQIEAEKAKLDEAMAAQEAEQANLEALIGEKEQQINAVTYDINNKEAAIQQYEDELEAMATVISQLEAQVMEEKRAIAAANGINLSYDGGKFCWPAPSYTRVSSPYGYRIHPTLGTNLYHNGVDLASPSGSKILAAYDGIVVAADYTSVMGNYIMIDHGDGLYTVYMHASALYVSKGDIVIKGEHIAAVGSTGRSTGPHLHFSVRKNGEYVDPMPYIT